MTVVVEDEWILVNKRTGEQLDLTLFQDSEKRERWDKVYAKSLASILELTGDEKTKVVTYLLRNKKWDNLVIATMREISEETGVSLKTVNKVMQIMQDQNALHKVRNGKWRFSPHIIVRGEKSIGAAVFRLWDREEGNEE